MKQRVARIFNAGIFEFILFQIFATSINWSFLDILGCLTRFVEFMVEFTLDSVDCLEQWLLSILAHKHLDHFFIPMLADLRQLTLWKPPMHSRLPALTELGYDPHYIESLKKSNEILI